MNVTALDESIVRDIGHAFGYYDYGTEEGLISAFPSRDAAASFICGYVRMAMQSGMLYTTGKNKEAFLAYLLPGKKIPLKAGLSLAKGFLSAMKPKDIVRFAGVMSRGEPGLRRRLDREKKPYLYVGLVCVRETYQGQGYMRRVMEMAFAKGNELGVPVILDTDASSKCEKYRHLGMELFGIRRFGDHGALYDLIKYPDSAEARGSAPAANEAGLPRPRDLPVRVRRRS